MFIKGMKAKSFLGAVFALLSVNLSAGVPVDSYGQAREHNAQLAKQLATNPGPISNYLTVVKHANYTLYVGDHTKLGFMSTGQWSNVTRSGHSVGNKKSTPTFTKRQSDPMVWSFEVSRPSSYSSDAMSLWSQLEAEQGNVDADYNYDVFNQYEYMFRTYYGPDCDVPMSDASVNQLLDQDPAVSGLYLNCDYGSGTEQLYGNVWDGYLTHQDQYGTSSISANIQQSAYEEADDGMDFTWTYSQAYRS